jgi:hypothetical protein
MKEKVAMARLCPLILIVGSLSIGTCALYETVTDKNKGTGESAEVDMAQQLSSSAESSLIAQTQKASSLRNIPEVFANRRSEWYVSHYIWAALHYILGIGSIICSVIVASLGSGGESKIRLPLSIIAAICAALLTFLSPSLNAQAYIQAWRTLDAACTQYQFNTQLTEQYLVKAMIEGERIIAGTIFTDSDIKR